MRFVIKIGTSLLTTPAGQLDRDFLRNIVEQIANLHKNNHDVVIVSSGAVGAGRTALTFEREKKNIPYRQALAAVGQNILMNIYQDFFRRHHITVAQALLTNFDFVNRENFLNTKNVFEMLLRERVIPIVNENDVTTIAELRFGDNDMLSAKTAAMVSADFLILMTDVDGLFSEDPKRNPHATLIPVVQHIDDSIRRLAGDTRSRSSLGGMVTKLEAAEYVTSVGIPMWILNGRRPDALLAVEKTCSHPVSKNHGLGTFFTTAMTKASSQKKWLRPKILKNAWIEIDAGATEALRTRGKSLLPSGVIQVHGIFRRGDVVMMKGPEGEVGYGQMNYSSEELDKIKISRSDEIEKILGYSFEDEAIHRDRMVILD